MDQIKKLKITDQNYPRLLKRIEEPPKMLYFRGKIPQGNCFAIVGTRRYSDYGKQIALEIAGELAEAELVIVSGLARGIDTFAHQGCLEKNGKTIAVLGTGLDEKSIYPKENLKLAKEIIQKQGALVSEYSPSTPPNYFHFPERNRIISGLSKGVLVIEAREKSGALITADWAFSQKKPVFAIPGSIYNETSKGCHILIKKGAKLVSSPKEILQFFGISFKQKSGSIEGTEEEKLIFQLLLDKTLHIDEIIQLSKLEAPKVLQTISKMELEGKIKNLGGNIFTAIS